MAKKSNKSPTAAQKVKPNQATQSYVRREHPDYVMQVPSWSQMEDLYVGEKRVKEQTTKYLPATEVEAAEGGHDTKATSRYNIRLANAVFFNGVDRLTKYVMGHIYRINPEILAELPEQMKPLLTNADMLGTPLITFMKNMSSWSYVMGHYHILVDYPDTRSFKSKQDQLRAGPYPYFTMISPREIIDWSVSKSPDGRFTYDWIVREEIVYEADGPMDPIMQVAYYTIWYRDRWEKYRAEGQEITEPGDSTTKNASRMTKEEVETTAKFIDGGKNHSGVVPLVTVYSQMVRPMVSKSPLEEAGFLNIHHYQLYSSFMNGLFYHLNPILHLSGVSKVESVRVGNKAAIITPRNGDAKYIEFTGTSMHIAEKAAAGLAAEMWESGMRSTSFLGANTSGDARRLSRADLVSWLNLIANSHETAFAEALSIAALWIKKKIETKEGQPPIKLNRDYDLTSLEANSAEFLLNARKAGEISRETFISALVRGEVLPQTIVPADEVKAAKKDLDDDVEMLAKVEKLTAPAPKPPGSEETPPPPPGGGE